MGNEVNLKNRHCVLSSAIADFLQAAMHGDDIEISTVRSLDEIVENSLVFSKLKLSNDLVNRIQKACFIVSELPDILGSNTFIIAPDPRLAFARTVNRFFTTVKPSGIGRFSVIHPTAKIGRDVSIGNNCSIGSDVIIGDHSEICNNVVINERVTIGKHCLIRSNVVIGEEGFGFAKDEDGRPIRIPHLGSVEIGDYVEIGNFTAIARGTLKNTIIHSHVKIDNLVHIAHNCIIGENTLIIACAEISGSSIIGNNCWLGVGSVTMQKLNIGDNCLIGIGAVVLKDVPSGTVIAGNPAKELKKK